MLLNRENMTNNSSQTHCDYTATYSSNGNSNWIFNKYEEWKEDDDDGWHLLSIHYLFITVLRVLYIFSSFNSFKNTLLVTFITLNFKFLFIYFVMRTWGSEKLYAVAQHHTASKQQRWNICFQNPHF